MFNETLLNMAEQQSDLIAIAECETLKMGSHYILMLSKTPEWYLCDRIWLNQFGKVLNSQIEKSGRIMILKASYEHNVNINFCLSLPMWAVGPFDEQSVDILMSMEIIYDPQGILGKALDEVL